VITCVHRTLQHCWQDLVIGKMSCPLLVARPEQGSRDMAFPAADIWNIILYFTMRGNVEIHGVDVL
jgi:hypothetical protein